MTELVKAYDSTVPESVPGEAPVVFPYHDGLYAWTSGDLRRFAGKPRAYISVEGWWGAGIFDLEPGCCDVGEVARAMETRRAHGLASVVYTAQASWEANYAALAAKLADGGGGPATNWLVAQYDTDAYLQPVEVLEKLPVPTSLPTLGKRLRAVGHQYANGPNLAPTYDISVVDLDALRLLPGVLFR